MYVERLKLLNQDGKYVWNSIDIPMRRLIFEMNRVGLFTKFCCFGFPYGEPYGEDEEPKTHSLGNCYVHFYISKNGVEAFKYLVGRIGSTIKIAPWQDDIFVLRILDSLPENFYDNSSGVSIHKYEAYVIIIDTICRMLEKLPSQCKRVKIIDGNSMYQSLSDWQVKPKFPSIIKISDFYKEYGKLNKKIDYSKKIKKENNVLSFKELQELKIISI